MLGCVKGYRITFAKKVRQISIPVEPCFSEQESTLLKMAINDLIAKGAIVKCKPVKGQFLSSYFLVDKPDGGKRFILNLKKLNKFIKTQHFKLEDLRVAQKLVQINSYLAKIDLKDAYFLVRIDDVSRKFLRFAFKGTIFEFT